MEENQEQINSSFTFFDQALEMAVKASFRNQGQICLCGSRLLVEKSIFEKKWVPKIFFEIG